MKTTIFLALITNPASAAVLLGTDFSGMTINSSDGNKADNITWTGAGLTASSNSLTLENVGVNQNDGELFDSSNAITTINGYFGGNTNISKSPFDGRWGTTVTVTVGSGGATLEDVVVSLVHATGTGTVNIQNRTTQITATVFNFNDLSNPIGTITSGNQSPGMVTLNFASPLTLNANSDYNISFLVESNANPGGHYAAFDSLEFKGTAVPEPSTTALLGLGGLALILRRRK